MMITLCAISGAGMDMPGTKGLFETGNLQFLADAEVEWTALCPVLIASDRLRIYETPPPRSPTPGPRRRASTVTVQAVM